MSDLRINWPIYACLASPVCCWEDHGKIDLGFTLAYPAAMQLGTVRSYADLVEVLRARIDQLDISLETLDEIAGWADRYASKVLTVTPPTLSKAGGRNSCRTLGPLSFGLM